MPTDWLFGRFMRTLIGFPTKLPPLKEQIAVGDSP